MNEPKRLLLGEASARERALLEAGAAEEPPPDAAALFAASLGLSAPGSTPAKSESPVVEPSGKLATSKLATSKLVVKWLAFAGAGMMAISSTWLVSKPGTERHPRGAPSAPLAFSSDEPAPAETRPAGTTVQRTTAPLPSPTSSIAAEIRELEHVRTLLRTQQSASALRELASYDAHHAHGALREEADFMHIEALTQAERRDEAKERAARFLEAHPQSLHAARVRALLESLDVR